MRLSLPLLLALALTAEGQERGADAVDVRLDNVHGLTFIECPKGTIKVKALWYSIDSEKHYPIKREIVISHQLFVATTEVTQGVWENITGQNFEAEILRKKGAFPNLVRYEAKSPFEKEDPRAYWNRGLGKDFPVWGLTPHEIDQFTRLASEKASKQIPSGLVLRLPTASEWMYFALAGGERAFGEKDALTSADENTKFTGEDLGLEKPFRPVSSFPANPWGLYDIGGNVSELVLDCFPKKPEFWSLNALTPVPPELAEDLGKGFEVGKNHRVACGGSAGTRNKNHGAATGGWGPRLHLGFRWVVAPPLVQTPQAQ